MTTLQQEINAAKAVRSARLDRRRPRRSFARRALAGLGVILGAVIRVCPAPAAVRTALLRFGGLGLVSFAAYQAATWAGLLVAGLSLLLIDWMEDSDD